MKPTTYSLPLAGLSVALAAPAPQPRAASTLNWVDCPELPQNVSGIVSCANLTVPLDYQDEASDETLTLNLARIMADSPKGSILVNPGGPGFGGRNSIFGALGGQVFK
jgi:hypothetical protein